MIIYFLLLLSVPLLAQTSPVCPAESTVIEYVSPVTHGKIASCAYSKDGATVKHGEEFVFKSSGELAKKKYYQHGKETEQTQNLPGVEEAPKPVVSSLTAEKKAVLELVQILSLKKSVEQGNFKVSKCDDKPKAWVMGAMMKSTVKKSYSFKDHCDVNGSFVANFVSPFPMNFDLRNLQDFNNVQMTVKMSLDKSVKGIRYEFEVVESTLKSPKQTIKFVAHYEVEIDILSGEAFPDTQKGHLTIVELDGKVVNERTDLQFKY